MKLLDLHTGVNNFIPIKALGGIEWRELAFPDVNMHVHVNVPEEVWSYALKGKV